MQSEKVISSNLEEKLRSVLRHLRPKEKAILSLYVAGYTSREIAERLDESVNFIRYEMNRLRAKVRHRLEISPGDAEEEVSEIHLLSNKGKETSEMHLPKVSEQEANLLLEISTVFPAEKRQRYNELYAKFENGSITEKENKELLKLSDEFEILNAKRLEYLGELAELRGQSLTQVIKDLGIKP